MKASIRPKTKAKKSKPVIDPKEYSSICKNNRLKIHSLKGIKNATIDLSKPLTAIMGVNGAGKTTVIHALACVYQPLRTGGNYTFPCFFIPTPDSSWKGSKLELKYATKKNKSEKKWCWLKKTYEKKSKAWPSYKTRPKRDVFYIGIDSCLPEIECTASTTAIHYSSEDDISKNAAEILNIAGFILNKDYTALVSNKIDENRSLLGVKTSLGLRYSSLSMGTGEQRVIKMLKTILSAPNYSMILIDEIDLLLHISALKRLIVKIHEIAVKNNLQIIFTTHSPEMANMLDYVNIQYLLPSRNGGKTGVLSKINSDLLYELTDFNSRPLKVYVEDSYSKCIIRSIAKTIGIQSKIDLIGFGAIENGFTIASSKILENAPTDNILIVLDGDKYQTDRSKIDQLNKALSGTEIDHDEKRDRALKLISQYTLPKNTSPEKFMHNLLVKYGDKSCEVVKIATAINAVNEKHQWVDSIVKQVGASEEFVIDQMIHEIANSKEWKLYIENIAEWLNKRKDT